MENFRLVAAVILVIFVTRQGDAQSLDFQSTVYYTATGTDLVSAETNLSAFDFSSAPSGHPLLNDGIYYPVVDVLNRNLWVRVRYVTADPNGTTVGHNVAQTSSSPFRSGGFGGWGGFVYRFNIYRDANLTGSRANKIGNAFRTSITVESIETLSDTEWVYFTIVEDPTVKWALNSIDFTGLNPGSNPGFAGTNVAFNSGSFSSEFPEASSTICVIDFPGGGYSEFSMTANGVSEFEYGYEYASNGGYQGMRLSFGTYVLLPTITDFTPGSGTPGSIVTITGTNFSAQSANNIVTIGGIPAVVTESTSTTLTVVVPANGMTGPIAVTVDENTVTSESQFTVLPVDEEPSPGEVQAYNAVSPNGDGKNDFFYLRNIELRADTRKNKVIILNRWGDVVFSVSDYDNVSRVFAGLSSDGEELAPGVYYYRVEMPDAGKNLSGYLELKY